MKRALFIAAIAAVIAAIASCSSRAPLLNCDPKQGYIECSGTCVTPNTDTENCGHCGVVCSAGQACIHGECGTACPKGNLLCANDGGSTCVNAMTDNQNCGACGVSCTGGQICYKGQCNGTCGDSSSGQTMCKPDGGSQYCANLSTDRNNCGDCGSACNAAQVCVDGKCADQCGTNQTLCDNGNGPFCTDISTDNGNCGGCGNACNVDALQVCAGGSCGSQCDAYQTLCTPDAGTPFCASTKSDNKNCGSCGNVCPSSKPYCSSGLCSATAPQGVVYYTNGTTAPISIVKCGNGTYTNCTSANAISACTAINKKLVVYENYYGTANVTPISTQNYSYYTYTTVGYFINYDSSLANQCLVGAQAVNSYYCGSGYWTGAVMIIPSTSGQQFGYIYNYDQGYQSTFTNTYYSSMYCTTSYAPYVSSCSTYYVACL